MPAVTVVDGVVSTAATAGDDSSSIACRPSMFRKLYSRPMAYLASLENQTRPALKSMGSFLSISISTVPSAEGFVPRFRKTNSLSVVVMICLPSFVQAKPGIESKASVKVACSLALATSQITVLWSARVANSRESGEKASCGTLVTAVGQGMFMRIRFVLTNHTMTLFSQTMPSSLPLGDHCRHGHWWLLGSVASFFFVSTSRTIISKAPATANFVPSGESEMELAGSDKSIRRNSVFFCISHRSIRGKLLDASATMLPSAKVASAAVS